jgi:pimeloyl-ACP methyl ester carboxylesterase
VSIVRNRDLSHTFTKVTGKTQFRGDDIAYTTVGKGRAVVLLHGFLGSGEIWRDLIPRLSRSYRVIAIDLPGHGESACYGYVHSMELMAQSVKSVLDHLRLRRYVLVGHSMGGYVALAFAELYPENVRGLCLFHSTAFADSDERKEERERAIALVRADRRVYTSSTIKSLFAAGNIKYMKEEIAFASQVALKTSRRGIVAALRGMKDRIARDVILGLVSYPVMMVIGAQDSMVSPEQLMEQSTSLKKPSVLLLEHDGHFGFLESPKRCLKALRKFLRICYR